VLFGEKPCSFRPIKEEERAKQAKKCLCALEYQGFQRFYVTATSGGNLGIFPPYMAETK
jgi:hypothetical protein